MATFDELVAEALDAPFSGWDFSWLAARSTAGTLPCIFALALFSGYELIFARMDLGEPVPLRVRLGVITGLHCRLRHINGFVPPYVWNAFNDGTFSGTRQVVHKYLRDYLQLQDAQLTELVQ